jgi:hypothetical protein
MDSLCKERASKGKEAPTELKLGIGDAGGRYDEGKPIQGLHGWTSALQTLKCLENHSEGIGNL